MVRHTKNLGAIHIAWGYDDACIGYFFTVYDDRLRWQTGQSSEVDSITEKVSMDGGGNYFDLNTYRIGGFGHKVSEKTMFTFMRRYGIDPDKIKSHDGGVGEGTGGVKECANSECRMLETETAHKRCARCRNAWYCSKACQTTDWISHKVICIEA
ncbi:hypothetical protein KI688_004238 [Linnemannia hyalina]|uniref:MYND-type domain-containing protein n=1 Tax=Linnemannia hyalina TaxID=64524 RepID=A0A9P8BPX5_9FUNG|nr:hypothetical protein KI688_004238 [Linnemannia hyalina]